VFIHKIFVAVLFEFIVMNPATSFETIVKMIDVFLI